MEPYRISVPDKNIKVLKEKLAHATLPDELDGVGWGYGVPLADLKRLVKYWRDEYNWREEEAKLNALPNFHKTIDVAGFGDLDIHYLHQPSESPNSIPLLFCHGWPGSYVEVTKMLQPLNKEVNGISFSVVAPSLPNFGWSQGVRRKDFGLGQYAEVNHKLMKSLGYERYATQGGDWGFYITRTMGLLYPDSIIGSHINMIRAQAPTFFSHPLLALKHSLIPYTNQDRLGFARSQWFAEEGSGYRLLQSTKPQTLGYSLSDSPVGLLAWIFEKLRDWTDNYPWTDTEILTWVSIYYFSTAGSAANLRIYYEAVHPDVATGGISRDRTQQWIGDVKLGICQCPRELTVVPSTWAKTLGPVVFESNKSRGGHFAAWEIPDEIVDDLRKMFGKGGPCYLDPISKL
ncbi:hypothetical protein M433DRAFT_63683 [Acidomyces richmondensis BFW]|nr:hypothetical protein M433DRAFT_63683 [Acidomyces richmondensis BFW]